MVVIRLKRGGSKKRPFFFIVAVDKRNRRDGGVLEVLGFYNPLPQGQQQKVQIRNMEAVKNWQANGAQLSDTVAALLKTVPSA
jgi:small subunit ribosomal protein S16